MSSGFAVASVCWLLIVARPTLAMTVAAVAIFAVGEMMQAPRFYEYVSNLAPQEQVGTFMGFAFLPVAIGSLIAGRISGPLVEYMSHSATPERMWLPVSADRRRVHDPHAAVRPLRGPAEGNWRLMALLEPAHQKGHFRSGTKTCRR